MHIFFGAAGPLFSFATSLRVKLQASLKLRLDIVSSARFRSQPFRTDPAAAALPSARPRPRMPASHRASAASRNIGVTRQILTESGNPTPISFASNSYASQDMLTDPYSAPIRLPAIRYSEKIGLLHKTQRISGQRRYEDGVFNYLAVIDVAKRAGVPSSLPICQRARRCIAFSSNVRLRKT